MKPLPIATLVGTLIVAPPLFLRPHADSAAAVDWSKAKNVEIRMIEYEFVPSHLMLRQGQPYRLHLVNAGKEGHDFTAPDFLRSALIKNTSTFDESGSSIFLQPNETADIYLVAQKPGLFAPRCADHDWAGMTATIVVE
jgi:uncharacterized cupredoxin-like copper-binding protein